MSPQKQKQRALLLYIAGDNDLSDAGLSDIQEMCDEGTSANVFAGVEIDTKGDHTGSIRYDITTPDWEGKSYRTVIDRLNERDSGKPESLLEFLKWGLKRYPTPENIVVIGGHGDGFRARKRGIASDDFGSTLDMSEIEFVFRKSNINSKNKINILGFDACLMCMLEIAHHFENHAEYLVGSQQTEPGDGWPYDNVLKIIKDTNTPIKKVANNIADEYLEFYKKQSITNITQSAIDIKMTGIAMKKLSNLGKYLEKELNANKAEISKLRRNTQTFKMADYIDVIHFCELLGKSKIVGVQTYANELKHSVQNCVVNNVKSGKRVKNANGLSIWFPTNDYLYFTNRAKYKSLRNIERRYSGWMHFIDAFHY